VSRLIDLAIKIIRENHRIFFPGGPGGPLPDLDEVGTDGNMRPVFSRIPIGKIQVALDFSSALGQSLAVSSSQRLCRSWAKRGKLQANGRTNSKDLIFRIGISILKICREYTQ